MTFPEAAQLGLIERVRHLLGDRIAYVIDDVQPNPDVAWLRDVHERFWREAGDCTTVFALGGGSAIDTAKALVVGTGPGASTNCSTCWPPASPSSRHDTRHWSPRRPPPAPAAK